MVIGSASSVVVVTECGTSGSGRFESMTVLLVRTVRASVDSCSGSELTASATGTVVTSSVTDVVGGRLITVSVSGSSISVIASG